MRPIHPACNRAVVLRFHRDQLPGFTLWKNTAGPRDGYVSGLEPASNYPNPRLQSRFFS